MSEEEVEYEVSEVRVEGDTVLLVLTREGDGFGVSIPYEQYNNMSETELDEFLEERVKERIEFLDQIKKQEEENKKKQKTIEAIKGRKIKFKKVMSSEHVRNAQPAEETNQ